MLAKFSLIGIARSLVLLLLLPQLWSRQEAVATPSLARRSISTASFCPAQLPTAIQAVTNRPQFSRSRWGIVIQHLSSASTLYSRDAKKYFIPASNVKLLTTASALHRLGAKFQIRTSIYGKNNAIHIVGRGDPSLSDTQLRVLAQQLRQRGIRQISQVIVDNEYFQGYAVNPTWEWEDVQADYGAPINSLILNQNAVQLQLLPQAIGKPLRVVWVDPTEATQWQISNKTLTAQPAQPVFINVSREPSGATLKITGQLTVDSQPLSVALAVVDPVKHFWRHFRRALVAEGVEITTAQPKLGDSIPKTAILDAELAAVESPLLSQLLVETNQNSNNLYAEVLLQTLAASAPSLPVGSTQAVTATASLQIVKATLTQLGVDPTGYVLADGSGLSRHNLVSPEAIAQTLKAMAQSPEAAVYRNSLPVAGMSGTLENRFRDSAARGIVQAKTGTMSGVVALSGYIDIPTYETLVFSIIVNQSDQPAAKIRNAIDEIVLLLTRLHHC